MFYIYRSDYVYLKINNKISYTYGKRRNFKMTEQILTKAIAVEMYGTDKQKSYFKKYKKLQKTMEEALLKTLEQEFNSEIEKVPAPTGRGICYKVGKKYDEVKEREDGRATNGVWSIDYTKNMDVIVVSALEQDLVSYDAQTMRKWLLDFKLVNRELFDLMGTKFNKEAELQHVKELINKNILEYEEKRIIKDYLDFTKELQGQLESTLKRMKKANIIRFWEVQKAKLTNGEVINIHESVVKKIDNQKRKLMNEYNVEAFEYEYLTNKEEVKTVKRLFSEFLKNDITDEKGNHIAIDFYWTAHAITLKATKKRILTYLKKYNVEALEAYETNQIKFVKDNQTDFTAGRLDRVVKLAQDKEDKFRLKHPHDKMKGKRKPIEDEFKFDTDYYALFFNNLYVKRIEELEKYYGQKFLEA